MLNLSPFKIKLDFFVKYKYIFIVIACGIVLLLLPSNKSDTKIEKTNKEELSFDLNQFEKKIETMLTEVNGVGKVRVMLTLESSPETIYAKEEREISNDTSKYEKNNSLTVISKQGGGESGVILKQNYPKFMGALIVCEGADDYNVCLQISQCVSAICGLDSSKISILKAKK